MRNQKTMKAGLVAGLILFLLVTIAAAFETANCVSGMNNGAGSVKQFKSSLNDLKIRGGLL